MSSAVILTVVLPIMLFVVAGYIFCRLKKFDSSQSGILISFAMKVTIPSMIIVALADEPIADYMPYAAFFGTFLLITTIVVPGRTWYSRRVPNARSRRRLLLRDLRSV